MLLIAIGMHEHNGHTADTRVKLRLQLRAQVIDIQRLQHITLRRHALLSFHHLAVKQFGQHNVPIEQTWAVLVGNAQCIAKAARGDQ